MTATIHKPVGLTPSASAIACVGVCGYLVGLALPLSPAFDFPLAFLVVLAVAAALVGVQQHKPLGSLAIIPVLGFVVARLLSALVSPQAVRSLQLLAPFLPALLLFLVLSEWVDTPRQILIIYTCLTVTGFALTAMLVIASLVTDSHDAEAWTRVAASPMLVVKNDITVAAVLAPLALAVAALHPRRLVLLATVGFLLLLVPLIMLVRSRTALVTAVVAIACFTVLAGSTTFTRSRYEPLLLLGGVVAVAFVADACFDFRFVRKVTHDWHGSGRLAMWAAASSMFLDAPFLGQGPSTFGLNYRAYLDALQLPGWLGSDARAVPWPHNLYLELLAEQGLLGLVAFLALTGVGLSMVSRIVKSRRDDIRFLGAGAGASFIAFLTAALFELSFVRVWVSIILFTLLGLLATISRIEKRGEACESH